MSNLKDFSLVSEVMCSKFGGIKCLDRILVSEKYGKRLREIRGVQNNKLYYVNLSDCDNLNKTLPIDYRFSLGADCSIVVLSFKVIMSSTELDINTLKSLRGMLDNTIKCLTILNEHYARFGIIVQ